TGSVFMALGRPQVPTLMGLFRVIIIIPLILWLSSTSGLEGVVQAILGTSLIVFLISNGLIYFSLKVPIWSILRVFARSVGGSLIMAVCVQRFSSFLRESQFSD